MTTAVLVRSVASATRFVRKRWLILGIVLALVVFSYASGRMVYLAFAYQSECIAHQKQGTGGVTAAKSSC